MMSRLIPVIIMAACVVSMAACKDDDPVFDEKADRSSLVEMEAQIDTLISAGTCADTEDCRSIAFGDKPCGGPWSYKIYSVSGVDTLQLVGLVDAYNKFNKVLNERHGWMSDCMVVMSPDIDCVEGRCVAVE
ncbi:MAG: hypothetical protein KAH56_14340 [Candidatus Krumholzibacteria bacterium]|nr:hypothetical protein [Candidatus Krumholzibacteria bacterium]